MASSKNSSKGAQFFTFHIEDCEVIEDAKKSYTVSNPPSEALIVDLVWLVMDVVIDRNSLVPDYNFSFYRNLYLSISLASVGLPHSS